MKNLFVWVLVFMPLLVLGQTPCAYYSKYIDKGNAEIRKGNQANFELAIDAYSTAMIHCPEKAEEARVKILEVFKAIERLKKEAENANKTAKDQTLIAESAKTRAEKLVRATRNLALAAEKNEYDPTMSLNIMRYNLMRHPEDESSKNNYLRLARYAQKMSCKKILPSSSSFGQIQSLDISDDEQRYIIRYQSGTYFYNLRDEEPDLIQFNSFIAPVMLSAAGDICLYADSEQSLVYYEPKSKKKTPLSSIKQYISPNNEYYPWKEGERFLVEDIIDKKGGSGAANYLFPGFISAYALSDDGTMCVFGTEEGELFLWHPLTGTLKKFPGHHNGKITAISLSADGKFILTGGVDWIARLWSTKSERTVQAFLGHTDGISAVALSPDGKTCLTAGEDYTFRQWDCYSGREKNLFTGTHEKVITHMSFTPDGKRFLTGNLLEPTRIWELKTGRPLGTYSEIRAPFATSKLHILTTAADNQCRLWELRDNQPFQSPEVEQAPSNVFCMQLSADQKYCLVGTTYQNIGLWNLYTNNWAWFNTSVNVPITALGLGEKAGSILAAYNDNTIFAYQFNYNKRVSPGGYSKKSSYEDSSETDNADDTSEIIDIDENVVKIITESKEPKKFSPDSILIDTVLYTIRIPAKSESLLKGRFSSTGQAFVGAYDNGDLAVWGLDGRKATEKMRLNMGAVLDDQLMALPDEQNYFFDISGDGSMLALEGPGSTALLWDSKSKTIRHRLIGHKLPVSQIALSNNGTLCATGSQDQDIRIWDTQTGQLKATLVGHTGTITALAFSSDNIRCISGSDDLSTRIWDVASGALLYTYTGYLSPPDYVLMPKGAAYFLSGSKNGAMQQWNIEKDCAACSAYQLSIGELWKEGMNLEPEDEKAVKK